MDVLAGLQQFGAAAGVLIVVYWGFQQGPSLISAIRAEKTPTMRDETAFKEEMKPIEELKTVINNNTNVTNRLIAFLDKSEAVREERDKQMYATLSDMNKKLDDIYGVVGTHATKCDSTCRS